MTLRRLLSAARISLCLVVLLWGCGEDSAECPPGLVLSEGNLCVSDTGDSSAPSGDSGPGTDGGASPDATASGEVCDAEDNDDDGRVDEDLIQDCGSDIGICTSGVRSCVDGELSECDGIAPGEERCDGLEDEDCDGTVDEGCTCAAGTSRDCGMDEGRCMTGTQECAGGTFGACMGAVMPTDEICNGEDDDCDGMSDEGNPGGGASCGDDTGECQAGVETCVGGVVICMGEVTGEDIESACDGLDEDCDGMVDEGQQTLFYRDSDDDGQGNPDVSMMACSAPSGYVANNMDCDDGCDVCLVGGTEVCDEQDNDCNSAIDEGVQTAYYLDTDSDGFGATATEVLACSSPGASYVEQGGDCAPEDADAYPGQTSSFTTPITGSRTSVTPNFDYNCDMNNTQVFGVVNCSTACRSGFDMARNCGQSGTFQACISAAGMCAQGSTRSETQECL